MCHLPTTTSVARKRQKNLVQSTIAQTTPKRGPGEIDITNLPEKEFKIKVITMMMDLQRNMQEVRVEVWRKITEMNQSIQGHKSSLDEVQETVNE